MAKPTILAVDDDPRSSRPSRATCARRYGADYRVVRATSGARGARAAGRPGAQGPPGRARRLRPADAGDDRHRGARRRCAGSRPDAKLLLLTAYADTDVAIKAINDIGLDYYLMKPWDPPEERLYPVLDDLLERLAARRTPTATSEVRVVGHRWSERTHEVKTFLARNHVPYRWLDVERDEEAARLLDLADAGADDLPLVLVPDGEPLRSPTHRGARRRARAAHPAEQPLYDLCIVGAGPAGLAAAVYAASEGLQTVVVERDAPGGQAGQSASIENYLGFPKGLSGADLTHRAVAQAARFGAEMVLARDVVGLRDPRPGARRAARRFGGHRGARGRSSRPASPTAGSRRRGSTALGGRGVYYGASASEAVQCEGEDVYVVGAANSAGQAALNFARYAKRRGHARAGRHARGIDVAVPRQPHHGRVEHRGAAADRGRRRPRRRTTSRRSPSPTGPPGPRRRSPTSWLFVFIGAAPRTDWLGDEVARDPHGLRRHRPRPAGGPETAWPLDRAPFALETSVPGVFAAGDVRLRLHEAGRLGRRRGRHGRLPRPPLPGDDLMLYDDLRAIALFDGFTDEQLAELAADGRGGDVRGGRAPLRRGPACRPLVGAARGQHRPRAADRPRGDGPGHDGPRRASGRAASGPGTSTASTWAAVGRRGAGRVFRLPAERLGRHGEAWFPFGVHLIGACSAPRAASRPTPASARRWSRSARWPPDSRTRSTTLPPPRPGRSTRWREQRRALLGSLQRLADGVDHRRAVRRPRRAAARRRRGARRRPASRWPTARTTLSTGSPTTGSTATG